jgi:hypothetical protein
MTTMRLNRLSPALTAPCHPNYRHKRPGLFEQTSPLYRLTQTATLLNFFAADMVGLARQSICPLRIM